MRLLLLAQFFPPDIGGEEMHVFNLANTLANRGHEVAVATQMVKDLPEYEVLASGVRVYRFPTMAMHLPKVYRGERQHHLPFPDIVAVRHLSRIIKAERPQVVHAHNWIVNSVLPLRHKGGSHSNFALVLTLHDYSNACATKRMMCYGSVCDGPGALKCLKCAVDYYGPIVGPVTTVATAAMRPWKDRAIDHVVCVSSAVASGNGVVEGSDASIIPNFILDSLLQTQCGEIAGSASEFAQRSLPAEPFLLFVGDLSHDKGVDVLLNAYNSLGPNRPPLVLVGRRTPSTPAALPKGSEMHFGWPHDQIVEAFRQCVAAVLPSVWPDPCPTTVLEAMAAGRPVVTTSIGGMVDIIVQNESGILVPPNDERKLGTAISQLLGDNKLRLRLGSGASERVRRFTASRIAEQLESIYDRVASATATGYRSSDSLESDSAALTEVRTI